ncbi:hypothetical protein B0H16DRAFT_1729033 [Mycena metata]|uniref:CxC2-like cysteine cluster KDZ transposase-associated domain-containing protein n=1 Tax=Mycena metata TaxID=1033252 RepID=A0AAD7ID10_9AGAR|nr:hypothetical protein B0H16DRAFT_1729033 [Mycena metata]
MPPNDGPNQDNADLVEMYMGIEQMLDLRQWQVRRSAVCPCGQPSSVHCNDCGGPDLCQKCVVDKHANEPFHAVREWDAALSYYTHVTFYNLGLRIKLGHSGDACPSPRLERREALTVRGLKTLAVEFCACANAASEAHQIKARGWWPMRSNFICALPLLTLPLGPVESDKSDRESSDSDSGSESDEGREGNDGNEGSAGG